MISQRKHFSIIAAVSENNGIGRKNALPWNLPAEMARFKRITMGSKGDMNVVIMGRNTWESIPEKFRPLKDRLNIVVSSTMKCGIAEFRNEKYQVVKSFEDAVSVTSQIAETIGRVYVIGGGKIYAEAIRHPMCKDILLTVVEHNYECDTFFPKIDRKTFEEDTNFDRKRYLDTNSNVRFTYRRFVKKVKISDEYQYLDLLRLILETGEKKQNRTSVDTIGLFGHHMRFDLSGDTLPMLTTKKVPFEAILKELLWFISGSTDSKVLNKNGVTIWDQNGKKEFIEKATGLKNREEGDLGPIYGFQWRHFGAPYVDCKTDYTGKGVDQLKACIDKIKNNPNDRRILMSAWNPSDIKLMALPPCHVLAQFYVSPSGGLRCSMYQRSCDMALGVPFNITSYCLLTHMIAHVCGLKAEEFYYSMGDLHVYENHVKAVNEQLRREPRPFPMIKINKKVTDIDSFKVEDFELSGYYPYGKIKMDMVA